MSDETFVDFFAMAPAARAVLAPSSTVYREARRPENAVGPGFWRIDRQKRRLKTAKTVKTGNSAVAAGALKRRAPGKDDRASSCSPHA